MHNDGKLLLTSAILGWFGKVYTSTYVLDEAATLTKAKVGGEEAVRLVDGIIQSKIISVIEVENGEILENTRKKFSKHKEMKGLSFTDCTTLTIQEKLKIHSVLSFDSNFRPFVPRLFGEDYNDILNDYERELLVGAMKSLRIS